MTISHLRKKEKIQKFTSTTHFYTHTRSPDHPLTQFYDDVSLTKTMNKQIHTKTNNQIFFRLFTPISFSRKHKHKYTRFFSHSLSFTLHTCHFPFPRSLALSLSFLYALFLYYKKKLNSISKCKTFNYIYVSMCCDQ